MGGRLPGAELHGIEDDDLIGLGNDFDILEYADPELTTPPQPNANVRVATRLTFFRKSSS